jgi:hypothetical protein
MMTEDCAGPGQPSDPCRWSRALRFAVAHRYDRDAEVVVEELFQIVLDWRPAGVDRAADLSVNAREQHAQDGERP